MMAMEDAIVISKALRSGEKRDVLLSTIFNQETGNSYDIIAKCKKGNLDYRVYRRDSYSNPLGQLTVNLEGDTVDISGEFDLPETVLREIKTVDSSIKNLAD